MLRIKERFTLSVGFSYLLTQFLGAILGSILGKNTIKFSILDQ
jgi:hypothetical protein